MQAFAPDEDELETGATPTPPPENVAIKVTKLNEAERKRLMKEKMKKKKEQLRQASSVAAASDMDALAQMIDDKKKHAGDEAADDAV